MLEEEAKTSMNETSSTHGEGIRRIRLSESEKDSLSREEWAQKWLTLESYAEHLEERATAMEAEIATLKTAEERVRLQNIESNQRERILMRRIATKDQELQDCMNQIAELKAGQAPGATALRSALLDPAVNLLLHRLRQEVSALKTRLEETQNELSAWKFTPDSNTGKRLMAKCRLLYQENEELGRVVSSGRLAKLEGDLALQKSFSEEVKKSQSELDEFLQDLDEDVEGMQSTIYFLQQELRKAKETIAESQQEKTSLKSTPSGNTSPTMTDSNLKSDESNNRTGGGEFRTGNQTDRLTNGNHSVLSGRTSKDSCTNKVFEVNRSTDPSKTHSEMSVKKNKLMKTSQTFSGGNRVRNDESSSDSYEFVLKVEAGDLCEEMDNEVNQRKKGVSDNRKRTFPHSDESSNDSDNLPLVKKGRRGSELSLDYNEEELGLTNGETKIGDN